MDNFYDMYDRGTILYTRNGRKIGNAVVLGAVEPENPDNFVLADTVYVIKTDFGNVKRVLHKDVNKYFYVPKHMLNIDEWLSAKIRLMDKGIKKEENNE